MPSKYPEEFRQDVIRVALERDPDVTLVQIAKDFGIHVGTLDKWLRQARIEAGEQQGLTRLESAELRELKKRRSSAGAGKRSPAPRSCIFVAVQSSGKRLYP